MRGEYKLAHGDARFIGAPDFERLFVAGAAVRIVAGMGLDGPKLNLVTLVDDMAVYWIWRKGRRVYAVHPLAEFRKAADEGRLILVEYAGTPKEPAYDYTSERIPEGFTEYRPGRGPIEVITPELRHAAEWGYPLPAGQTSVTCAHCGGAHLVHRYERMLYTTCSVSPELTQVVGLDYLLFPWVLCTSATEEVINCAAGNATPYYHAEQKRSAAYSQVLP